MKYKIKRYHCNILEFRKIRVLNKQILHPKGFRKEVIFMPRYSVGSCGPVICSSQLSLLVVLEAKHGQMEHAALIVAQGVPLLCSLAYHTLDKAKFASAHVG